MSEAITSHQKSEDEVRRFIKEGGEFDETRTEGLEEDPTIAVEMAYAAKPFIDQTLNELGRPQNFGFPDTKVDEQTVPGKPFGVMNPEGGETTHEEMKSRVDEGYRLAEAEQRILKRNKVDN